MGTRAPTESTPDHDGQFVSLGDGITIYLEPGETLTDDEKDALREYFKKLLKKYKDA